MLKHPTINKLHELRLNGMADALAEQQGFADRYARLLAQ